MRTWVLLGAMIIAIAINPDCELPNSVGLYLIATMVLGFTMDVFEFLRRV